MYEGPEFASKMLEEWNTTTLHSQVAKNPDEPISESFKRMTNRLSTIQLCLDPEYQTPSSMYNKIKATVSESPHLAMASKLPANQTVQNIIHSISSAIEVQEAAQRSKNLLSGPSSQFFTDRKYRSSFPARQNYS